MRTAAVGLLATFALLAAGCGSGGKSSSLTPLELVSQAVSKTTKSDSAKFQMTITETVGPLGPLTITANGVSDNTTHSANMTMDLSSVAQLAGGAAGNASDWKADTILDGTNPNDVVEYMRLPILTKMLPGAKPWVKIDLSKLSQLQGINFSQLLQAAGQQDPSQMLQLIQSVGNVQKVGSGQIDGVDTSTYSGTLDPAKIAAKYSGTGLDAVLKQLGTKPIPVTVWVDGNGYVRKLDETMSVQSAQAGSIEIKVEALLSDFGTAVDVTPPPADQTTDLATLLKKK